MTKTMKGKAAVNKDRAAPAKYDERRILLFDRSDKEQVIITARHLAAAAGFDEVNQFLIATAASELATNIVNYAQKGELTLRIVQRDKRLGIEIIARDNGPGIRDIEQALQDNFSTTKGSLGLGLPSVKRIMDEFEIESRPGSGTVVSARKWSDYVKSGLPPGKAGAYPQRS
ncbi:MAG: anti-sigma regulatory factor [Desulfobacterales bacterium]